MKYIVANWKSNKILSEVKTWLQTFLEKMRTADLGDNLAVIAPPFPFISYVNDQLSGGQLKEKIALAVQDISPFPAGSYTGAVSARNLEGLDVRYAIVGHSERRRYFHETHQDVANKISQCLENGLTPIVCVDDEYIARQAEAIAGDQLGKCIVAYEELGAIGTGNNEPLEHVLEVRGRIKTVFGEDVPVLYGGSVTVENAPQYLNACDGLLIGGTSLEVEKFGRIVTSNF